MIKKAEHFVQQAAKKIEDIISKAKEEGNWQMGLDSNEGLFDEVNRETKEKLKILASMIDED